jgi:hypothetical protein
MRLYLSGGRLLVVARFRLLDVSQLLARVTRNHSPRGGTHRKIGTDGREQVKNVKVILRFISNVGEDPRLVFEDCG